MICEPWGVDESLKGIAKICMGCRSLNFSRDTGFSCGWVQSSTGMPSSVYTNKQNPNQKVIK